MGDTRETRLDPRRRIAAALSLAALVVVVVGTLAAAAGNLLGLVVLPVLALLFVVAGWTAATRQGTVRIIGGVVAAATVVAVVALVLSGQRHGLALLLLGAVAATSVVLSRYALRKDKASLQEADVPGTPVGPARHGALIMNLKSGGGKAERFGLAEEAAARGIEAIVLQPGDDLLELAQGAVDRGADVLGMAGGDGSQALVASVATKAGVPLVCIPAGTRNHFALDLGLDRDDVVGALDAFGEAVERTIDLATVGDRVFVNNVSLGVYAKVVQSPEYRDAKRQTVAKMLPELLGPDAEPFDMRFTGDDGQPHADAQIIQVSNNPYVLTSLDGFGSRPRLDTGQLGIAAAELDGATDVAAFVAAQAAGRLQQFPGWHEWSAPTFTVESDGQIEAGVDGEAMLLDAPLEFRCLPGALRVRLPRHAPGYSPAALRAPSAWWTITALCRAVLGEATPIDEQLR